MVEEIFITCPHCGHHIMLVMTWDEVEVKCSACGGVITIALEEEES